MGASAIPTRFPAANLLSLSDPADVEQASSAIVHKAMVQLVEAAGSRLRLRPHVDGKPRAAEEQSDCCDSAGVVGSA